MRTWVVHSGTRSSYVRFEAAQPSETWQSDFTHWRLRDGTDVEILNWLGDHSRLLSCTAHRPVTGKSVVDTFLATIDTYGPPASTLTDNGRVYTARHGGGRNEFEYVLAALGIVQKNGAPNHPQTQGKIERFHQTLKRWLTARPRAATITELQAQLDQSREHYNTTRPHRARGQPPRPHRHLRRWFRAPSAVHRVLFRRAFPFGRVPTLDVALMVGIGGALRRFVTLSPAEAGIGAEHPHQPDTTYWRNTMKAPGRWPEAFNK